MENKKCPYIDNCTLYINQNGASALSQFARKNMCESIGSSRGEPVVPATRGWGDGSGSVCEAYHSKKILEELLEIGKKGLETPLERKYKAGKI